MLFQKMPFSLVVHLISGRVAESDFSTGFRLLVYADSQEMMHICNPAQFYDMASASLCDSLYTTSSYIKIAQMEDKLNIQLQLLYIKSVQLVTQVVAFIVKLSQGMDVFDTKIRANWDR